MRIEDRRILLCHRTNKDGGHLFVKCKGVKGVWRSMNLEHIRQKLAACSGVGETLDELWKCTEKTRVESLLCSGG
jgi:hypothetical protein